MKLNELIDLLRDLAEKDLADNADIQDHPCSVAVRAITTMRADIDTLLKIAPKNTGSKKAQMLTGLSYRDGW